MTEDEWSSCVEPRRMLSFAATIAGQRKFQMFVMSCRARVPAEKWLQRIVTPPAPEPPSPIPVRRRNGAYAAALVVDHCRSAATCGISDEAERARVAEIERRAQCALLREVMGNPFRRIEMNPSWLTWNAGTVVRFARGIARGRSFDQVPVLGDALEDAGCDDPDILAHCRQPAPHVRGCWLVDLILERTSYTLGRPRRRRWRDVSPPGGECSHTPTQHTPTAELTAGTGAAE